jgi:Transposase DDE domain
MTERKSFDAETLARLPLLEAVVVLLRHVLSDDHLKAVFAAYRGASYEDMITFAQLVTLMAEALTGDGTLATSLQQREEQSGLEDVPTRQAYYAKLSRIPLSLSLGFFRESVQRLQGLHADGMTSNEQVPGCFDGLAIRLMDGKKIKHVAKRTKATRGKAGKLLGAVILAGYDPRSQLVDVVHAHLDGDVNECKLVEAFMASIPSGATSSYLMVADAQFGDIQQPRRILAAGQHFLLRRNGKMHFHPDPQRPAREYRDKQGRLVREEWGKAGSSAEALEVRHMTVIRPGQDDLCVFTDLLDPERYPALDLLSLYGIRWDIETLYHEVTMVFGLRHLIGSTPRAAVFQTMFCLLLANVMYLVQGYLAAAGKKKCAEVSTKKLMKDTRKQMQVGFLMLTPTQLLSLLPPRMEPEAMRQWMTKKISPLWKKHYEKAIEKNKRPKRIKEKKSGSHHSAYKLMQEYKERQRSKPK